MISDEAKLELEGELDKARKARERCQEELDELATTTAQWMEYRDKYDNEVRALEVVLEYAPPQDTDKFKTFGEG